MTSDFTRVSARHAAPGMVDPSTDLVALVEQLQQNWDHGDNAANDDLVLRIREHIRKQRSSPA